MSRVIAIVKKMKSQLKEERTDLLKMIKRNEKQKNLLEIQQKNYQYSHLHANLQADLVVKNLNIYYLSIVI